MGKTTINYVTVDKTDPKAQEKGRQAARDENALLVQKMEQRLNEQRKKDVAEALTQVKDQNEQDSQEIAENKRRQAELEAKRIKEENYQQEQLSCLRMKQELLEYEFGQKSTMKTFESECLDVTDMKKVRIALFGPTGSGKTSFVGTVERSLLGTDKQTAFEQGSGSEGTIILEEYLSSLSFNLVDTRGFFDIDNNIADECLNIMTGKTKKSDVIERVYDDKEGSTDLNRRMAKFGDRIHAVVFVIKANDRRLKDETYLTRMKKIRDHFRKAGHSTVTIITCEDLLKDVKDRETAFTAASAATGSSEDRTYFITNYTHEHKDYSLATEKTALKIVDTVLLSAERFVKIYKLREVHHGSAAGASNSGDGERTNKISLHVFTCNQSRESVDTVHRFLTNVYKAIPICGSPETPIVKESEIPVHLLRSKPDFVVIAADKEHVMKLENQPEVKQYFTTIFQCIAKSVGKRAVIIVCSDDECLYDGVTSEPVHNVLHSLARGLLKPDKLLVMSWNKEPRHIHMEMMVGVLVYSGHTEKKKSTNQRDATRADPLHAQIRAPGAQGSSKQSLSSVAYDNQQDLYSPSNQQQERRHEKKVPNHATQGRPQEDRSHAREPVYNERRGRLRYQAVMSYGRITHILYCDPPGWQPQDYMIKNIRTKHGGEQQVKIEIWEDRNGMLYPVVPVNYPLKQDQGQAGKPKYDERGNRCRYQAMMMHGHVTEIRYSDPPGWQPPDYMIEDIKTRHQHQAQAKVEFWEDGAGGIHPVVTDDDKEPGSSTWHDPKTWFNQK